jgi:hypothetical protein
MARETKGETTAEKVEIPGTQERLGIPGTPGTIETSEMIETDTREETDSLKDLQIDSPEASEEAEILVVVGANNQLEVPCPTTRRRSRIWSPVKHKELSAANGELLLQI